MPRSSTSLVLSAVILCFAAAVSAQNPVDETCVIGAYADAEGTIGVVHSQRDLGDPLVYFEFYTVLHAPGSFLNAVAWSFEFNVGEMWFENVPRRKVYGTFLEETAGGFRMGIGQMVNGAVPVTLMLQTIRFISDLEKPHPIGTLVILPHAKENSEYPVYNSSQNVITACSQTAFLLVTPPVNNESESWGRVKALYINR